MGDESELANAPKPGEIFAERYRVDRILGVGGMGYVLAATHIHLRGRVAIKMLLPELARHAETVERFLREGRAAIKIRSEHCVRVLDVGELADRTPYMVMEYLEGSDLAAVIKSRGRVPVAQAVDYLLEACEAIAEAHAMKIVHRDLKPANLFLQSTPTGGEHVKVLDFGISKMETPEDQAGMSMTKTSALMGSPLYMSPEQLISSKKVDERADQWALGVILYELIAGKPPFMAETLPELGALVLSGDAPWLGDHAREAPQELSQIVATCLRKKTTERFVNLADMADALAPFGSPKARVPADIISRTLGMPSVRTVRAPLPAPPPSGPMSTQSPSSHTVVATGWGAVTPAPNSSPAFAMSNVANPPTQQLHAPPKKSSAAAFVILPLLLMVACGLGGVGYLYKTGRLVRHDVIAVAAAPESSVVPARSSDPIAAPTASASPTTSSSDAPIAASAAPSASAVVSAKTAGNHRPKNAPAVSAAPVASTAAAIPPPKPSATPTADLGRASGSKD